MKAVMFSDGDAGTELLGGPEAHIAGLLRDNGDQLQVIGLQRDKVAPCRGCFLCATPKYRGMSTETSSARQRRNCRTPT